MNPFNINKEENEFLAWQAGYESNNSENPFSDDLEPKLYNIWAKGYSSNKNRAKKPANLTAVASSMATPSLPTPVAASSPAFDLAAIPTDQLFLEVSKRLAEGQTLLDRVKKLLG